MRRRTRILRQGLKIYRSRISLGEVFLGMILPSRMALRFYLLMVRSIRATYFGSTLTSRSFTGVVPLIILPIRAVRLLSLMVSTRLILCKVRLLIAISWLR